MTPDGEDEAGPFLQRWSRRKREREAEDRKAEHTVEQASTASSSATEPEPEEHRQQLERNRQAAEAIDLDGLNARSDLSPFFKAGVPKALKMSAMRAVWRSDPVFANLDGLNDYEENFADPELVRKFAGTAWKVGKGYLFEDQEASTEGVAVADAALETPDAPGPEQAVEPETTEAGDAEALPEEREASSDNSMDDGEAKTPDAQTDMPEKVTLRRRLALDHWRED